MSDASAAQEAQPNVKAVNQAQTREYIGRLAARKGINPESLKNPQTRIDVLRSFSSDQFLELLTVTNAKLRGEYTRWQRDNNGQAHRAIVKSGMQDSADMEGPEHPERNFAAFFEQMQREITPENMSHWSAKVYTAIIFLHMFPDGNGRLARNAFQFMNTGELATDEAVTDRPYFISTLCNRLNTLAIEDMLKDAAGPNHLPWEKYGLANSMYYQAEEASDAHKDTESGLTARLKWIAAKRAGIIATRAKELGVSEDAISQIYASGETYFFDKDGTGVAKDDDAWKTQHQWTLDELIRFKQSYEQVRDDWFDKTQQIVDATPQQVQYMLQVSMNLPGPGADIAINKISDYAQVVQFIGEGKTDEAKNILVSNRYKGGYNDEQEDRFIATVSKTLGEQPNLKALVMNPPFSTPRNTSNQ